MEINFLEPVIDEADIQAAVKVLRSGWITRGKFSEEFEAALASYLGAQQVVVNSSGTAALHVALMAAGIGPEDEVITTPLSYVATSNAILYVGAKPVFVDVEPSTGLMDVSKVEAAITQKTKAILPVHLYGQMIDMRALKQITDRHQLVIIEDACHAIESERDHVRPGALSFAACFSFHAAKNLSCGEGGAISVNDRDLAERLRLYSDAGVKKGGGNRSMITFGYKYSITEFQVALLINQLQRIEQMWEKRRTVYEKYVNGLKDTGVEFPHQVANAKNAYHMFVLWGMRGGRDALRQALNDKDIPTSVHYNPIHLEPYYRERFGYAPGAFPVAEKIGESVLTLPLYPSMTNEKQDYIISELRSIMGAS